MTLTEPFVEALLKLGCEIAPLKNRSSHLFGIKPPSNIPLDQWQESMLKASVHASTRGDYIRIAPHLYNDERDMQAFLNSLIKLK